jgi:hypothetical protein
MKLRPLSVGWLVTNVVVLLIFLYFCSWVWAPSGEEGLLGGPGDPIIFGLTAFPTLLFALILNVIWLVIILFRARQVTLWKSLALFLLAIAMWGASIVYVRSRMFTGCEVHPHDSSCASSSGVA